ncbi:MAG: hypothetical protein CXZ00_15445 [Acidobacteria bacterium]|nr:MAG: hypothetical protein CXZ00_15445 [Acidobacteriota bacterium]
MRGTALSAFSLEFRLLLACCLWPHSNERTERVARALQPELNWFHFLRLTERHRVTGLVHHALSHLPADAVPELVRKDIAQRAALLARQNLRLATESVRIARLLENAGITVKFLKGVPLAIVVYGGLSQRHSRDIDLLVPPESVVLASSTLTSAGYYGATPAERLTKDDQIRARFRHNKHIEYVHHNSGIRVELHAHMFINPVLNEAFGPEHWEPVPVGGNSLLSLKRQELILYLCLHGAMHSWFRLKWLVDIGALLTQATEQDIQRLLQAAKDCGITIPVLEGIQLSSSLLGELPLKRSTAPGWRERALTHLALKELCCESVQESLSFRSARSKLSHYLLRSDWRYLSAQLRSDSTGADDPQIVRLPAALHFLYPILRPFSWIIRHLLRHRTSSSDVLPG